MNKKKWLSYVLAGVGVFCILYAIYGLYDVYKEYKLSKDIYDKAQEEYVHIIEPTEIQQPESEGVAETEDEGLENTEEVEQVQVPWYQMVSVDLAGLQSKYKDVVGWIFFENETISYPVMQGEDNNSYLRTTYDGVFAWSGSIFVEATHSGDFSDVHTIVYGHNQKTAQMFGKLKNYKKIDGYYDDHQYFQIFHDDKIYRYHIFAYQVFTLQGFIFTDVFASADTLAERLRENSMISTDIPVEAGDRIVNLVTCTDDVKNRFVVSAVLEEIYDRTNKCLIEN